MKKFTLACLAAISLLFAAAESADAQVVVYTLEFSEIGPNINYREYKGGFIVMPLTGGNASFVLQFTEGLSKQFIQVPDFGVYFIATQGTTQKGVLANADSTDGGTPINTFNMIGDLNTSVSANTSSTDATTNLTTTQIVTARLAKLLEGFILTTDSTTAGVFDSNAGSAGTSSMKATLDEPRTKTANNAALTTGAGQSVTQAITDIVAELQKSGETEFIAQPVDTTTTTTTTNNANNQGANGAN